MKKKEAFTVPFGADKVLLHTCCAPCSSAIIECLMSHGVTPTIYYCNPNIYPYNEYAIRRDECMRYARDLGIDMVESHYDHDEWRQCVHGLEHEPERGSRCLRCFQMRLKATARYAHDNGFKVITTTLASSRWKSLEQINQAGSEAAMPYDDVTWWDRNWRKGGLSERRAQIIRDYGFYNQRYCGCEFSMSAGHQPASAADRTSHDVKKDKNE